MSRENYVPEYSRNLDGTVGAIMVPPTVKSLGGMRKALEGLKAEINGQEGKTPKPEGNSPVKSTGIYKIGKPQ